MKVFQLSRFTDSLYFFFPAGRLFMKKQVQICCKNHVVMMEMFSNNIYRHFPPPVQVAVAVRVFFARTPTVDLFHSAPANTKPTPHQLEFPKQTSVDRNRPM